MIHPWLSVYNDLNSSLYKFACLEVLLICSEVGQKNHSCEMKKKDAFRVLQGNIISSLPSTLYSTRRQNHMMDTFRNEIREDADKSFSPNSRAIFAKRRDTAKLGQGWVIHLMSRSAGRISTLSRGGLKSGTQVWWILVLLLFNTSAWLCLQHSQNLGPIFYEA